MSRTRWMVALASASWASTAHAHPPPEIWNIVSSAEQDVILTTTRGTLFGNRQTGAWRWLCVEGFDETSTGLYGMAELPSGRLLASTSSFLQVSDDRGCTWQPRSALMPAAPTYLVQAADARERVYVAMQGSGQGGVHVTSDGGESFQKLLGLDDAARVGSLLVAASAPRQLYAAISTPDAGVALQHSRDDGQSWEQAPVTLAAGELDLTLLAVNAQQPEQLVARASVAEPIAGERLLWSRDGGKTFHAQVSLRALRAALFSADGDRLFVAGRDGIVSAQVQDRDALQFTAVSGATRISVLLEASGQLLAGGYYQGDDVGVNGIGHAPVDVTGSSPSTLARWMDFYQVTSPIECPSSTRVAETCDPLFIDYEVENPPPLPTHDAGAPDAGDAAPASSVDATAAAVPHHDAGCSLASHEGAAALHACWLLALARRRLRSRPAHG